MNDEQQEAEIRTKNRRLLVGIVIFALALAALVVILMLLRGPAKSL